MKEQKSFIEFTGDTPLGVFEHDGTKYAVITFEMLKDVARIQDLLHDICDAYAHLLGHKSLRDVICKNRKEK